MVNDYEEPLKLSTKNNELDNSKICGASHLVVSEDVPPIQDTLKSFTLKSGSLAYEKVVDVMEALEKLPKLFGVSENVTAVTRLKLFLSLRQVSFDMVEEVELDYRIEKENIVLELKAILDTGSESVIVAKDILRKIIIDGSKDKTASSVFNKR